MFRQTRGSGIERSGPGASWLVAALAGLLLASVSPPSGAQDLGQSPDFNKGGRTSLQFLKIGMGARQAGLGEAAISAVEDVNSVFWNPANIRGIERVEASFSYIRWLADMNYVAGAVGGRWSGVGLFALSVAALDYGQIQEALVSGGSGGDTRTGNTFTGSDLLVGLTYAREFTDRLSIGVGVKWIREDLFDYSVNQFAFDVGTSYHIGYKGTRLAMSAQNFSGSVKWLGDASDRQEGYDLPFVFRIGLSTNLLGEDGFIDAGSIHDIVLSVDAINTNDFSERVHVGGEYRFANILSLRAGYRVNYSEGNLSFGAGVSPSLSGIELRVDYAYVDYEFLEAPHRLSVSLAF
jgi:hypothetical protein